MADRGTINPIDPRRLRRLGGAHTVRKMLREQQATPFRNFPTVVGGVVGSGLGGGSDFTTFLSLSDTPSSFGSQSLNAVRVNVGETALEFYSPSFLLLADTPATFVGQSLKAVRVNVGETALEFYTPASSSPGGSDKYLQFNDGGSFGGDSRLQFDKTNGHLTINTPSYFQDNRLFAIKFAEFQALASLAETPTTGYAQLWFKDDSGTIDAYFVYDGTNYSILSDADTLPQYVIHATVTATGSMTITPNRNIYVPIQASTANITLTVGTGTTGFCYTFKRRDSTSYTVTISASAGIDGGTTIQLKSQFDSVTLLYDGSQYYVV